MIGDPYTIAVFPSDLTGHQGRVFVNDVFSVTPNTRRKRSEIALAIDRQGINVYDIRSSRLVTSYVISPQATITCPPCSFRSRLSASQAVQRHTYCSIVGPKPRILGFLEQRVAGKATQDISTLSTDITSASPIVHLDIVPQPGLGGNAEPPHTVIAVHEAGQVSCYSPDLGRHIWTQPASKPSANTLEEGIRVEYAAVLSEGQALKALLTHRRDITRFFAVEGQPEGSLLFTLESNNSNLLAKLYTVETESADDAGLGSKHGLSELSYFEVPLAPELSLIDSEFSVHVTSATLYQRSTKALAIYDLRGFVPRLAHLIQPEAQPVCSSLRLSSTLLATATNTTVNILGLPYCSLQASKLISSGSNPSSEQKDNPPSKGPKSIRLLSYSTQHKVLTALIGHKLVALSTATESADVNLRKRNREGLLIASLGRKFSKQATRTFEPSKESKNKSFGQTLAPAQDEVAWNYRKASIDRLLESGDCLGFELAMTKELDVTELSIWPKDLHKVSYVLSKIFTIVQVEDSKSNQLMDQLQVAVWPSKVCQWLMSQGLLVTERVESALKQSGAMTLVTRFAPGDLLGAISRWDPTLSILQIWFESPSPFSAEEIGHAISAVNQRIQVLGSRSDPKLLTNGEIPSSPGTGQDLQDPNADASAQAMSKEEGHQPQDVRSVKRILYSVLGKLKTHPSATMAQALQKTLTNAEIRSLIDILRVEMADNGWLSLCTEEYHGSQEDDPADNQLTLIAYALTTLFDSLGPTGWMSGQTSAYGISQTAETISYMKAEVSAALEGIEEATYLRQMLGEMLVCGKDALRPPPQKALIYSDDPGATSQLVKPTIIPFSGESNLLPLGLKLKPKIAKTKVGAGGEVIQRSQRDIGRLKSRKVGKYSFERIEI